MERIEGLNTDASSDPTDVLQNIRMDVPVKVEWVRLIDGVVVGIVVEKRRGGSSLGHVGDGINKKPRRTKSIMVVTACIYTVTQSRYKQNTRRSSLFSLRTDNLDAS